MNSRARSLILGGMDAARFRQIEELFEQALSLSPEAQAELLADVARHDPGVARRVEAMLAADAGTRDVLRQAVEGKATGTRLPGRVGPFRVLSKLGEGGMGVVYLCRRQTEEFEQLLAVKRLNAAFDSELARQRLAVERRVLASLRHPNIAQLVDGGEDADGAPFVAMEFVDGLPIDRYVREHGLDRGARIRLFLDLCQAVQFAHQHLIVHRDIKSANVLIDSHGQLKLLDFGIAKLIGEERGGGDDTVLTVAGAMTPHYASPEQIRGEPVTPLTDIYSLGVVLYELLADRRPYEIRTRRPTELERIICHSEPAPPFPGRRGRAADLNSIVAKAMHKDPARRYQSAGQLSEDLQRWLEARPVLARPDSSLYRLSVFARRHPAGVGLSALIVLLLVGFSAVMGWQAQQMAMARDQAEREAAVANQTSGFLIELFQHSDPRETNPAGLSARDLLDQAALRIARELEEDPLMRARLMQVIGLAYGNLGLEQPAVDLLSQSLALREELLGPDHALVADSFNRLGNIQRAFGRFDQAEPLLLRALEWRQANGPVDHDLADSWNNVGLMQNDLGWSERAEVSLRRSIELHRQVGGGDAIQAAAPLHNLALALRAQGRFEEARQAASESVSIKRANDWSLSSLAVTLAVLANIERQLGNLDIALAASEESLALREQVFGRDNARISSGLVTHARILHELGRSDEAEQLYIEAARLHEPQGSSPPLALANVYLGYGRFLHEQGRQEESAALLASALNIAEAHYPADAPELARYRAPLQSAP